MKWLVGLIGLGVAGGAAYFLLRKKEGVLQQGTFYDPHTGLSVSRMAGYPAYALPPVVLRY
jgi:hypothetical protein